MATKSVPRPKRPKKASGGPMAYPPKGLTLADVTAVTRHVLKDEMLRISGSEVAKLIYATAPDDHHPPLVSTASIYTELDCLAELVQVLGERSRESELPLDVPLYWVGESLKRLGRRVMALEPSGNNAANWYAVVTKKAGRS